MILQIDNLSGYKRTYLINRGSQATVEIPSWRL